MEVKLYDSNLSSPSLIADLTPRHEKLRFSTRLNGGFHLCSFNIKATLSEAWEWVNKRMFYHLLIKDVSNILWEGRINSIKLTPARDLGTIIGVTAVGYYANLGDKPYYTVYNNVASTVIKAVLTANCSQISSDQSHIATTDISIGSAYGTDYLDIYPQELVDKLLAFSDSTRSIWYFAIWDNRVPYLFKKSASTVDWYASVGDFTQLSLTHRGEMMWNSAYATSESGGGIARTGTTNNTASQTRYNLTRQYVVPDIGVGVSNASSCSEMIVNNFAAVYPRETQMILGDKVKDSGGVIHSSYYVRAGDVLRIVDLVPSPATDLDGLRTFYLIETEYDVESHTLRIVPDTDNMKLDAILARRLGI